MATFIYKFRYNFSEPGDNKAFSISATPALGISFFSLENSVSDNKNGIFHFNIPIMAGYEFGAGATYNSTANMGGHIGVGVE